MWLNKFAGAAVKALEAEFVHQQIETAAEKSEFVHFLLGDADNLSSKNRPFLWQSVYDDPDARQEVCNVEIRHFLGIINVCCAHFFAGAFSGPPRCTNIPEACSRAVIRSPGVPRGGKANRSTHCFNTGGLYLPKSVQVY
jgi:hypothetical protein